MKKIAIVFFLVGIFCVANSFAQSTRKTRPRIVKLPTSKTKTETRKPPVLIRDSKKTTQETRKPPVLINDKTKNAPTDNRQKVGDDEIIVEGDDDEITIETNYVTLPVSVLDRNGRFVSGLGQNDFKIFENGVEQKVEYFASVEKPFTVVLMIDTSPSTAYKIDEIHRAAISFTRQLRTNDKVMVVAFDESYTILTRPTNNRYQLERAIRRASFGGGTSIYDAVSKTISRELKYIQGRKAIVLFTDGVDTTSNRSSYQSTIRQVEEVDALIYPIRYDTSRQYSGNSGNFPRRRKQKKSILGIIVEGIINGGISGGGGNSPAGSSSESYRKGKEYLEELARYSGGRKFEASTTKNLDGAFRSIAEELRRQYSLGYYPPTGDKGERRKIRVRVMRSKLVVRTKNSYIVGENS